MAMVTSDWIALSVAIGTIALAVVAFWAIWQTRGLQKSEKRQRLLNEIIEWAIEVTKCGLEKDLRPILDITYVKKQRRFVGIYTNELAVAFEELRGRSQYVGNIVSTFGQDLQEAVLNLTKDLESHIKLLGELRDAVYDSRRPDSPEEFDSEATKVRKHITVLDKSAYKVIEEAVKIKTKDIG